MLFQRKFLVPFLSVLLFACGNNTDEGLPDNKLPELSADSTAIRKSEQLNYVQSYDRALTLWKVPFDEREITTVFGNAHVICCGPEQAEPLVLLHGMNASSTMWYPNIRELSKHFRVYAIDFLLEPGKSSCEGDMNSTDELVTWYYQIFDKLGLKKFSLLGASRGGWLAVNIALKDQDRVNRLGLLSPAQTLTWIKPLPAVLSNITYTISPKRKRLRNVLETMTSNVDNINQLFINQYYIATKEAKMNKCIMQMQPFPDEKLSSLKMPVLILIGDNDIINNEKSLDRANKLMRNVETGIIPNAGHFLSMDQPEVINKKILDFLTVKDPLIVKH